MVTPVSKPDALLATGGPTPAARIPRVDEVECVGCNLCWLVCPVENCITMAKIETGIPAQSWAQRTRA
jgi:dihydropyrimidine dehydrogenase (NAD+) subunit PreA